MFNKLKGKKDEVATKAEEKKEEKKEEQEEKKAEKEGEKSVEATPTSDGAGAAAPQETGMSPSEHVWWTADTDAFVAERAVGAPVEDKQEPAAESGAVATEETPAAKPEEKAAKQNKRTSIFGRMSSGLSAYGFKSPAKEKSEKDAELKPETPAKDTGVAETAPQLPKPETEPETSAAAATEESKADEKPAEATKDKPEEASTQQKGFLSGLPFMNKRNRSVSPSANATEASKKEETPATKDESAVEPTTVVAPEETVKPAETPAATESTDKPAEKSEEPAKEAEATPNKRSSMFGNLGRRASKAFNRMQSPNKKENAAPAAAETKKEETNDTAAPAEDKPAVNGENKAEEPKSEQQIGDVVPGAVNTGEQQQQQQTTPVVAASA